jgi:hypothetical protein
MGSSTVGDAGFTPVLSWVLLFEAPVDERYLRECSNRCASDDIVLDSGAIPERNGMASWLGL